MATRKKPQPALLFADASGQIYDHPDLLMVCQRGAEIGLPRPDELIALPEESEFFMLPGRLAVGFDPEMGEAVVTEDLAVAAFVSPGHTITAHPAWEQDEDAPTLPLLAYSAVGFAEGRFWVAARKVDDDPRQVFTNIPRERIEDGAKKLMSQYPDNRLISHLAGCALKSGCPAAKNLCLGRFEAPLPTSQACNARCVGCISHQPEDSGFPAPQCRISFTPTVEEIVQVMRHHEARERRPIFSFGQGCEGEPLTGAPLLVDTVAAYRREGGTGTVNLNTNGSIPSAMPPLAVAGLSSIRVSLNSARKGPYLAYYRPQGYGFEDVMETIAKAREVGLFVSLNLLYFPGFTDTEPELEALVLLGEKTGFNMIQLRNLNMDPALYRQLMAPFEAGPAMGFANFKKRLTKALPDLRLGYFNPYLG